MRQVVIRGIDDRVLDRLKVHATRERKSLEQSLRDAAWRSARPGRLGREQPSEVAAVLPRF
jgi:plasmid stability protein